MIIYFVAALAVASAVKYASTGSTRLDGWAVLAIMLAVIAVLMAAYGEDPPVENDSIGIHQRKEGS